MGERDRGRFAQNMLYACLRFFYVKCIFKKLQHGMMELTYNLQGLRQEDQENKDRQRYTVAKRTGLFRMKYRTEKPQKMVMSFKVQVFLLGFLVSQMCSLNHGLKGPVWHMTKVAILFIAVNSETSYKDVLGFVFFL